MREIHHFIDGAEMAGASGRFGDIYVKESLGG